MILGALEAGGTKMVCSVGNENGEVHETITLPTDAPEKTLRQIIEYFSAKGIQALGIAGFGPLDLDRRSKTYGYITTTPKAQWEYCALLPIFKNALGLPVGIDTDAGAAALAEFELGAGKDVRDLVYITVGNGIGGGVIANGQIVHGMVHPEYGHFIIKPHPLDPNPDGFCPYHISCLEGMAAGSTFEKRWGMSNAKLPEGHIGWEIEAYYLAQCCVAALLILSTQMIVLGGGVMNRDFLYDMARSETVELLNGYIANEKVVEHMDRIIVRPGLGNDSGVVGALILAAKELGV
ncbi:MAG: ROK family protein [Clostridia bacterium]|nr:ROK family protein [Clostridia bacterium]